MIDKAVSMVITMVVVLLLGIVLYVSVFSNQAATQQASRISYEQEHGELLVNSLLLSHDGVTDLTYGSLIALSIRQISTTVTVNGNTIDVRDRFAEPLDAILGKDNYYFAIDPLRKGVAVSYILDGSPTMADKRVTVKEGLPRLIGNLTDIFGKDAVIYTDIYILSEDTGMCGEFIQDERQSCTVLTGERMYARLVSRGIDGPYPPPFTSYSEWQQSTHWAKTSYFSESDWASAAMYASYEYQEDRQRRSLTNKHVIIAVADEMTSSSKSDECFTLLDSNENFFCNLCNATCPVDRSQRIINETKAVLADHGDLFIGFHHVVCDYTYNPAIDAYYLTPYACRYLDDPAVCEGIKGPDYVPPKTGCQDRDGNPVECPPDDPERNWMETNPGAGVNWCRQDACGACTPAPSGPSYCFHTDCEAHIIDDLQELASVTGGTALPLTDLQQLTDIVGEYFSEQLEEYDFEIGIRNETWDRYAVEQPFMLADGTTLDLSFWIYD